MQSSLDDLEEGKEKDVSDEEEDEDDEEDEEEYDEEDDDEDDIMTPSIPGNIQPPLRTDAPLWLRC